MEFSNDHQAELPDMAPNPQSASLSDAQTRGIRTEQPGFADQDTGRADDELLGGPAEEAEATQKVGRGALAADAVSSGSVSTLSYAGDVQRAAAYRDQDDGHTQQGTKDGCHAYDKGRVDHEDGMESHDPVERGDESGAENGSGDLGTYVERSAEEQDPDEVDKRYGEILGRMRDTESSAYQATTAWHGVERALSNQANVGGAERREALDEAHALVSRTLDRLGPEDRDGNLRLTTDKAYQSLALANAFSAVHDARLDRRQLSDEERAETYARAGGLVRTVLSEFEASGGESQEIRYASTSGGKQMRYMRDTTETLADCLALGAAARPGSKFMLQPMPHNGAGRRADASVLYTDSRGRSLERVVKISVGGNAKPRSLVVRAGSIARHSVFPDLEADASDRGLLTRLAFNRIGTLMVVESQGGDIGDDNRSLLTKFSDRICEEVARRSHRASGIPDISASARF